MSVLGMIGVATSLIAGTVGVLFATGVFTFQSANSEGDEGQ
ncbi:hypothetical protein [Pontivivens insulae]|uniref:Uncharacterized protein n=1 Tax=Pontivivens insulae TaxID=1639689 RepID=A0A2R8ACU5_9RHOB|nr:hypothetical protein [Pontivivens insulae]RED13784.1 hypothetical protein DFR53_1126 [Pontivivens insulae]SPF29858.1 hypothetical protein POI8812_02179 [Pontivivens insulae]